MNAEKMIKSLYNKNAKEAYTVLLELERISEKNDVLYNYFDEFIEMMHNDNSYIRIRGYKLLCKQAKWDKLNKINQIIDEILNETDDEKPIAVRQKITALNDIARNKRELNSKIKHKISHINISKYKESMQELILRDSQKLLNLLENMEVKLVRRKETIIGGFSVETTLKNSQNDIEVLYKDFYNGKMQLLNGFTGKTNEYFGVIWYTKLHERYMYLIGQEIGKKSKDFEIKAIPEGQYACSKFSKDYDGIRAWTEFYEKEIPETGYKPIEKNDVAFEYYPNGLDGDYELWSLVEKNNYKLP